MCNITNLNTGVRHISARILKPVNMQFIAGRRVLCANTKYGTGRERNAAKRREKDSVIKCNLWFIDIQTLGCICSWWHGYFMSFGVFPLYWNTHRSRISNIAKDIFNINLRIYAKSTATEISSFDFYVACYHIANVKWQSKCVCLCHQHHTHTFYSSAFLIIIVRQSLRICSFYSFTFMRESNKQPQFITFLPHFESISCICWPRKSTERQKQRETQNKSERGFDFNIETWNCKDLLNRWIFIISFEYFEWSSIHNV